MDDDEKPEPGMRMARTKTLPTMEESRDSREKDDKPKGSDERTKDNDETLTLKKQKDKSKEKSQNKPKPKGKTKPLNMRTVTEFVNKTLTRGVKDIIAEFRAEKRGNDFTKMKVFVENNTEGRNRYKDVGCLDETRVELTMGPVGYIHANYVTGHKNPRRFICTQAPLDKTIPDFWYMIVQERCQCILMLCNHKEQNARKCADYFPQSVAKAMDFNGIRVNAVRIGKQKFRYATKVVVIRSELSIIVPGEAPHKCIHLHWKDWPDRGVPPADLAPIELCGRLNFCSNVSKAPIVVHCSAGIGRTGSIVLIDLLLELHRAEVPWDPTLLRYLRNLRAQRNNSVQTEQQYLYVHQVMLNYLINYHGLGKKNPKMAEKMEKFTAEYKKHCAGF